VPMPTPQEVRGTYSGAPDRWGGNWKQEEEDTIGAGGCLRTLEPATVQCVKSRSSRMQRSTIAQFDVAHLPTRFKRMLYAYLGYNTQTYSSLQQQRPHDVQSSELRHQPIGPSRHSKRTPWLVSMVCDSGAM
jgi:hypothetical protein